MGGELGREPHQVRLAADVLQTTWAVLADDHAQRPLTCVQSTNRCDHPLVQAVHEQLMDGGLIIAEDPHSGLLGADDFSSAPAVGVQEMLRVTLRPQVPTKIEERRQLVIQPLQLFSFVGQLIGHQAQVLPVEKFPPLAGGWTMRAGPGPHRPRRRLF